VTGATLLVVGEGEIEGPGLIRVIDKLEPTSAARQVRFRMNSPTAKYQERIDCAGRTVETTQQWLR
jgi:hypothetical protein